MDNVQIIKMLCQNLHAISLLVFITYTIVIFCIFGIPQSYSQTYYLINRKWPKGGMFFSLFCVITPYFLIIPWIYISEPHIWLQVIAIFAGIGLLAVGASPQYEEDETQLMNPQKIFHYVGAGVGAIAGIVWGIWYYLEFRTIDEFFKIFSSIGGFVGFLILFSDLKSVKKHIVFWAELFAYLLIYWLVFKAF